jgi:hypothetical protein
MSSLFFLIFCVIIDGSIQSNLPNATDFYDNSIHLVKDQYILYWNYTTTNLTAEIHVKTYGWVSFGITESTGSMQNADIIVSYVTTKRTVFIDSHYDDMAIIPDYNQNWILMNSLETNGFTIIKFSRLIKLKDVDPSGDLDIEYGTPIVSYGWGPVDPVDFINYENDNKGMQRVPLLTAINEKSQFNGNIDQFSIGFIPIEIPNHKTDYFHCTGYVLPSHITYSSNHVIKYATSSVSDLLFDWKLWICPDLIRITSLPLSSECEPFGKSTNDYIWQKTLENNCQILGFMWAKGGFNKFEFPDNIGYPIGTAKNGFSVFVHQKHFHNPNLIENITDSSGVSFEFTPDLRDKSASSLIIGSSNNWNSLILPPKTPLMRNSFYCYNDCTLQIDSKLMVFASYQHTFIHGTKITTTLVRNGHEIAYIGRNKYYNSNNQFVNHFSKVVEIKAVIINTF